MLDKFIFENHLGQRFDGLTNGVFLNYSDLRNYAWSYDLINNRISRFYRSVTAKKLPLTVCCKTKAEADAVKNRLLDIAEADIEAVKPGRIYVGDYYITGYITASEKDDYLISGRYCRIDVEFTSAVPAWRKETTYIFGGANDNARSGMNGYDYPYEFPFDYAVSTTSKDIVCDSVRSNHFRLRIYGEITDPVITIAGHAYKVHGMIKKGETLLIDSANKTITLTTADGKKVNWFNNRDRESYIFEQIKPGVNLAYYDGTFKFDLTVIEERSEPKWT